MLPFLLDPVGKSTCQEWPFSIAKCKKFHWNYGIYYDVRVYNIMIYYIMEYIYNNANMLFWCILKVAWPPDDWDYHWIGLREIYRKPWFVRVKSFSESFERKQRWSFQILGKMMIGLHTFVHMLHGRCLAMEDDCFKRPGIPFVAI